MNNQELQIEVYNSKGEQQFICYTFEAPDLSELPSGEYHIRFRQGDDSYNGTFIKD